MVHYSSNMETYSTDKKSTTPAIQRDKVTWPAKISLLQWYRENHKFAWPQKGSPLQQHQNLLDQQKVRYFSDMKR